MPTYPTLVSRSLITLALLISGCAATPTSNAIPPDHRTTEQQTMTEPGKDASTVTGEAHIVQSSEENNIYFALGSTEVDETGKKKLRVHALRLQQNPKMIVTLTGLTDNSGSRSYNLLVAERRTEAVSKLLRSYGAAKNQIRPYVLGNKTPDAPCNKLACRQKLRRVELTYPAPEEADRSNSK